MLTYILPLSEVLYDFFDQVKSVSSGYARYDIRLSLSLSLCLHASLSFPPSLPPSLSSLLASLLPSSLLLIPKLLFIISFEYDDAGYQSTKLVKVTGITGYSNLIAITVGYIIKWTTS